MMKRTSNIYLAIEPKTKGWQSCTLLLDYGFFAMNNKNLHLQSQTSELGKLASKSLWCQLAEHFLRADHFFFGRPFILRKDIFSILLALLLLVTKKKKQFSTCYSLKVRSHKLWHCFGDGLINLTNGFSSGQFSLKETGQSC